MILQEVVRLNLSVEDNPVDTKNIELESEASNKSLEVQEEFIDLENQAIKQTQPVPEKQKSDTGSIRQLFVGKIAPGSVFEISQSVDIEPRQIPFKVMTYLDNKSVSNYLPCFTILKNSIRASETDCESFNKNFDFDIKVGENVNIDTKIAISDLNLAPYSPTASYPDASYFSIGDNQIEIVVALVKNDPSLIHKITGDTSPDLKVLTDNAIAMDNTDAFVLRVKK